MVDINRRRVMILGASGLIAACTTTPAFPAIKITVTGNFKPLPIAIPFFSSQDEQFGREVAAIVRRNLQKSGLFRPLNNQQFPVQIGSASAQPTFGDWRNLGADGLVMGTVNRSNGNVVADVRLWDATVGEQVFGEQYVAPEASWRRIAHKVSDAIYAALTGEGGYFDTRIVYIAETGPKANRIKRVAVMDQDGASVRYMSSGREAALTPRFSNAKSQVAYMNFDRDNSRVYLLDLNTGRRQQVGRFSGTVFSPRFSPDGSSIVLSVAQGADTNLYRFDLATKQTVRLTNTGAIDTSASFAPDGTKITFESDRGGTQQIYVMNADGTSARRISFGQGRYATPVWSPKGDLIAFTKFFESQFHIGIMKPDGSGERILASSFHNEGPTWAPNGRVIMFFRDPGGESGPRLHTVDVWGRNETQVATQTFASDPSWSPLIG